MLDRFKRAVKSFWEPNLDRFLMLNAYSTFTGRTVDGETALQPTAAWGCIRFLADVPAMFSLKVYQELDNGTGKDEVRAHPLWRVFNRKANPYMSAFTYRQAMGAHLAIWGDHYALKAGKPGDIKALWPILPKHVRLKERGQSIEYLVRDENGAEKQYTREEVFHVPLFTVDGIRGISPVEKCREAIGLNMGTEEFAARYFGNGTFPGVVLEVPGKLSDTQLQQHREAFEGEHKGVARAFRLGFIGGGMKLHQINIEAQRAQLIEARNFQIEEMCRIWRIPPHAIQHLLRATFNNIEHLDIQIEKYTALPFCKNIEQAINCQLFSDLEEIEGFSVEHNLDTLRRGDYKTRTDGQVKLVQSGIASINEARAMENWNPIEGGDEHRVQMQMVPLNAASEPEPEGVPQ